MHICVHVRTDLCASKPLKKNINVYMEHDIYLKKSVTSVYCVNCKECMLTRSPERVFNPMRYTGLISYTHTYTLHTMFIRPINTKEYKKIILLNHYIL